MKAKDEKLPIWTLPNRLSIIRILFIPLIILCMEKGFPFLAFLLFLVAGITDGLDGFIARRLSMIIQTWVVSGSYSGQTPCFVGPYHSHLRAPCASLDDYSPCVQRISH